MMAIVGPFRGWRKCREECVPVAVPQSDDDGSHHGMEEIFRVRLRSPQDRGVMVRAAASATEEDAMRPVRYSWKEALNIPREIVCTWVKIGFRHMTSIEVAHSRHEASSIHRFSCKM